MIKVNRYLSFIERKLALSLSPFGNTMAFLRNALTKKYLQLLAGI